MKTKFLLWSLAVFMTGAVSSRGAAIEWRYAFGVHDMTVPEADNSHTYGVDVLISAERTQPSGIHWLASYELLIDRDKDELDPDHIPVWWRLHGGIDGPITRFGGNWQFSWVGDFDSKANTVSSVEREIKAMPGLALGYHSSRFNAGLKAAVGWYFLEIDDDVPRTRGYDRGDFRHNAFAGTLALQAAIDVTPVWKLLASTQWWAEVDGWLETRYLAELRFTPGSWKRSRAVILSVEVNQYNLAPYVQHGTPAPILSILPWDSDRLVKLSYSTRW